MKKNPIITIIQVFQKHEVIFLLMGGQACILYGASEFTRDTDFCVLCDNHNLTNIQNALNELKAAQIFFPPLQQKYLDKGHACHFKCGVEEAFDFRIDIMSKIRNCPDFDEMWKSRNTMLIDEIMEVPVMNIRHLIKAKKTQRDKDWPMVRRLVEIDYAAHVNPDMDDIVFWFVECRTPQLLLDLYERYPSHIKELVPERLLLESLSEKDVFKTEKALLEEELIERQKDREYWNPLKKELENMRHAK
ncbi:MAG: hypothetical protein JW774_11185 [Candidatus Aureabacteria bacterium]|nr:hypothetical protein [Candidatus Auribacterota bacterium]